MGNAYLLWTKRKQEMCNKIAHDEFEGDSQEAHNGTCALHDQSSDGWTAECTCLKCGKLLSESSTLYADPRPGQEPEAEIVDLEGYPAIDACLVHEVGGISGKESGKYCNTCKKVVEGYEDIKFNSYGWTTIHDEVAPIHGSCSVHDSGTDGTTAIEQCPCGVTRGGEAILAWAPTPTEDTKECPFCHNHEVSVTVCACGMTISQDPCPYY